VYAIHAYFDRAIEEGKLQPCNIISKLGNYTTLEMGNRYFTPIRDNQYNESLKLSSEIDPYGYMAKAAAGRYIHCDDNVVRYYIKEKCNEGHYRYFFTLFSYLKNIDL
jgi:hypothetical protein